MSALARPRVIVPAPGSGTGPAPGGATTRLLVGTARGHVDVLPGRSTAHLLLDGVRQDERPPSFDQRAADCGSIWEHS
jgi:hypothetical protein